MMSYLMMDLNSVQMIEHERAQLMHPMVGGVILFSRNFSDRTQLCELVRAMRAIRPELVIAVDHEGGRVQRFREGFSAIPAMGAILPAAKGDLALARSFAKELGFLMAVELLACDIDLSFAPVLDLNGISEVIGLRSFGAEPHEVIALAESFIEGMKDAGMAAVGKHFPGHGSVAADSHIAMPVDSRSKAAIFDRDMQPFKALIQANKLDGIMPAHVVYEQVDPNPAGFSPFWLQQVLRSELGFNGVIFSDDLGMKGAAFAGDYLGRAEAALSAGCDMILLCNDNAGVSELLTHFRWPSTAPRYPASLLKPDPGQVIAALQDSDRWQAARDLASNIQGS
jgi:beta-N-acetylhexosaminidase